MKNNKYKIVKSFNPGNGKYVYTLMFRNGWTLLSWWDYVLYANPQTSLNSIVKSWIKYYKCKIVEVKPS